MKISDAIRKLERLDPEKALSDAVSQTLEQYEEFNKDQLYAGKDKHGNDLSPTYLNDPFFKTPASAQKYSDWKDKITPNSKRKRGVPNLFINGRFYHSWAVKLAGTAVVTVASDPSASKIEGKFSNNIYGLDEEYMKKYRAIVRPMVRASVKQQYNG